MAENKTKEEIGSIYDAIRKAEMEFPEAFGKIGSYPFGSMRNIYNVEQEKALIEKLLDYIAEFYKVELDAAETPKEAYQYMHQQALVYKIMGIIHGLEFPEEIKLRYGKKDTNYLELLLYIALVLTMPDHFRKMLKIEGQKEVFCEGRQRWLDFAIINREGVILYDIECDGEMHNEEEDRIRDEAVQKHFPICKVIRIKKDEIYDGFSYNKKPGEKNYATNTARQKVWDVVEQEWEKKKSLVESDMKRSHSKSFLRRIFGGK